jgi:hypothetical protein
MTNQHPITPPPELVKQWEEQFLERPTINGCFIQSYIATQAAQWGADQELEACCEWLDTGLMTPYSAIRLRSDRRSKPPTLKEQALALLSRPIGDGFVQMLSGADAETIRRALEALPE